MSYLVFKFLFDMKSNKSSNPEDFIQKMSSSSFDFFYSIRFEIKSSEETLLISKSIALFCSFSLRFCNVIR